MNKLKTVPARSKFSIFRQVCNLIPQHMVSKIARDTGAEEMSRTFSPWSHVVSLGYAQLTHSIGLNDLCDSLQLHSGPLSGIRGATPPSRNGLSKASQRSLSQPGAAGPSLFPRISMNPWDSRRARRARLEPSRRRFMQNS